MKIRLEYSGLESLTKQLNAQLDVFQQCIAELNRLIHSVPDSWAGRAAEAYVNQFDELQPAFEQTECIIEQLEVQVKHTMAAMKEKDEFLAKKLDF